MTISYTEEMKLPLNEDGGYNWGAIANGIFELLEAGNELTFTFGEDINAGECVALSSADGKIYKAQAKSDTLTPAIGFAPNDVTADNEGKVRYFGWIDVDTSYSYGASVSWSAGEAVYPDSIAGRVSKTQCSWANPIGYAKGATDTSWTTRFTVQPNVWDAALNQWLAAHVDQDVRVASSPTFAGLTLSGLTENSVVFIGENGILTEDAGFYWNNTGKRLYIKGVNSIVNITRYGSNDNPPSIRMEKARGSVDSEVVVQDGDGCGGIESYGYDGSSYILGVFHGFRVDGSVSVGDVPMCCVWEFGSSLTERMKLCQDGTFTVGNTSGSDYIQVDSSSILSFVGAAQFTPPRVSQSATPSPSSGCLVVHRDSDDGKTYLVYNDPDEGIRSVEMT